MPWKDFTSAILTSPDVDTYLMNQAVVQCTSGARPSSPPEGMVAAVQDKDRLEIANAAGNWVRGPAWDAAGRTGAHGPFGATNFFSGLVNRVQIGSLFDSDGGVNLTADNYTIPIPGLWYITFQVIYGASFTAATHYGRIAISGSNFDFKGSSETARVNGTIVMPLSSGDVVDFHAYQDSGATQNVATGSAWSIYRLGT